MTHLPRGWFALLAIPLLAVPGCAREAPEREPELVETVDGEALEGLSPEEIRDQAAPMTPERAESLGIVDTTIHMEEMYPPFDTAIATDTTGISPGR